jgi:hypothetical protein
MSEKTDALDSDRPDKIEIISQKIYEVILSSYRLNSNYLQIQHRNYSWDNEQVKAHIDAWIVKILGTDVEPEVLIGNIMKVLNYFMASSFFVSASFLSFMDEVRKITYPEISIKSAENLIPQNDVKDLNNKAISILLLDAENLNLTVDIETFLAGVCTYPIQIKIAFANWRNMGKKDIEFHNRGYELIHVPAGKDSADVKMATVGSSIFVHYPNAKEVLVCSSDEVLTHLCNTLQTHGLNVYLVRKQGESIVVVNTRNSQTRTYEAVGINETISPLDFLGQIKEVISLEQTKTKQRWIKIETLHNAYLKKYGSTIEKTLDVVFAGKKFKDVLADRPMEFALHEMPDDNQTYITIFNEQEFTKQSANQKSSVKEVKPTEIKSPEALRKILIAIIEQLTDKTPGKYIKVSDVGASFYNTHHQPITTVTKSLGLGSRLTKVLQGYPNLDVKQVGIEYQVAIAK